MKFDLEATILGVMVGKSVTAPATEPIEADNMRDALRKVAEDLPTNFNQDLRITAITISERQ